MFSGIVQEMGKVAIFSPPLLALKCHTKGLNLGASLSVSGVCLTVAKIEGDIVFFDLSEETLRCTTLSLLKVGDRVNCERALKYGDEVGGHLVSGHIHEKVEILEIQGYHYTFSRPLQNFFFHKSFIALDGVSLTLCDPNEKGFSVHFIPETLARTTFAEKKAGDFVNLEYDSTIMSHALCRPT